jgi:hypothetical protein
MSEQTPKPEIVSIEDGVLRGDMDTHIPEELQDAPFVEFRQPDGARDGGRLLAQKVVAIEKDGTTDWPTIEHENGDRTIILPEFHRTSANGMTRQEREYNQNLREKIDRA